MKEGEVLIFEKENYPVLKLYFDRVKVKDRDYWEFRTFYFQDLKMMKYRSSQTYFNFGLIIEMMSWLTKDKGPASIKFWKTSGDTWWYELPSVPSEVFFEFYKLMEEELQHWREENYKNDI